MRSNLPLISTVVTPLLSSACARRWAVALCLFLPTPWGYAESADALPADVRVVIDISGSMKKNDPANLRQPSLALLLQLLPESSRAGIWTFGEGVNPLVAHGDVTADWKRTALDLSRQIGSSDLFTQLGAALDQAAYDRHLPRDRQTHILLLTDGMVDIDKNPQRNDAERQRIVDELLPQLQAAGYTVHTIALSEHADRALLDQLAAATGGVSAVAHSADTLMKAFLRLFDQTAPADQVPLKDNRFWVDSSIEEFTALVFRRPGSDATRLTDPANTAYSYVSHQQAPLAGVNWHRTEQYDLITVRRPQPGEWQIMADITPESRVTIVSNLKLFVKSLPHQVFAGQKLGLAFRLQEQGGTLTEPAFLDLLEIYGQLVQQVNESGEEAERWQSLLSNEYSRSSGVYQTQVEGLSSEGDYRLTVVVDGKTFQRQFTHYLQARAPAMAGAIAPAVTPTAPSPELLQEPSSELLQEPSSELLQEPSSEPLPEAAPAADQDTSRQADPRPVWTLYAILGGGNLLLLLLGLIAYRLIMSKELQQQEPAADTPEADDPILPIELDVEPEPEPEQDAPQLARSPAPGNEQTLNEQEVDALFAELEGDWNNNTDRNSI